MAQRHPANFEQITLVAPAPKVAQGLTVMEKAYGVFVQNFTAQWVYVAGGGFMPPNTSGTFPLDGTKVAQATFQAPPAVAQPAAVVGQTCFLTYVDYPLPPNSGPTQSTALASVATLERFARAALPAAGSAGRLVELTDYDKGIWIDDGVRWHSIGGEVWDARAQGCAGDGVTDDTAAIVAAFTAMAAAGGGILYFPPFGQGAVASYLTSGFTVPNTCYIVMHPSADLLVSGPVQLGAIGAPATFRTGAILRIRPSGAYAGTLLELFNLLGDSSLGGFQVTATLSAAAASNDFVHMHSTNGLGFADVILNISTANFLANRVLLKRNGGDLGGVASVAGDFINGNKIYGSGFACVTTGIRDEATGPVAGSAAGTIVRNEHYRLDVNSYTGAASRGYSCDGINVSRNWFYDNTFERASLGGSTIDIDSSLGGGQYWWHPICRTKATQALATRDVWYWDEFDNANDAGIYHIAARYVQRKSRVDGGAGLGLRAANNAPFVGTGIGVGPRNFASGEADIELFLEMDETVGGATYQWAVYRSTIGVPANGAALGGGDVQLFASAVITEGLGAGAFGMTAAKRLFDTGLNPATLYYYYVAYGVVAGGGFVQIAANPSFWVNGGA